MDAASSGPCRRVRPYGSTSLQIAVRNRPTARGHGFAQLPQRPRRGVHTGPERLSEAIVVRLAGRWGPDGNRLNARELYQSWRLNPPRPLYPLIIEASTLRRHGLPWRRRVRWACPFLQERPLAARLPKAVRSARASP